MNNDDRKQPPVPGPIDDLLAASREDEQLQLCDELARGDKTAAEVDAALGEASPRVKLVRQMSEPLDAGVKDQLVAMLLQPAPAQPNLSVVSGGVPQRRGFSRRAIGGGLAAAGLALAASFALYFGASRDQEPLPVLAMEVAENESAVLGAPPSAGPGPLQVHAGGCLDLRLRPQRSYSTELQTTVWFVATTPDPGQPPVPWPVTLRRTDKGLLQLGACEKLPVAVTAGSWQLTVVYGQELPAAAAMKQVLTQPATGNAQSKWQIVRQPMQVSPASH